VSQHNLVPLVALFLTASAIMTASPLQAADGSVQAAAPTPATSDEAGISGGDPASTNDAYVKGLLDSLAMPTHAPLPIGLGTAVTSAVANNPGTRAERRIP
jgi:hypothetical protein